MTNLILAINGDEQYYTSAIDKDIMKYLISKGHHFCLLGVLYPAQWSIDCALAPYFYIDNTVKSYCFITVNTINRNSIS